MAKMGHILSVVGVVFVAFLCSINDLSGPFTKNGLIIFATLTFGVVYVCFCAWLIHRAQHREKRDYQLLILGGKSSFLRQRRRIPQLKKR